MAPFYKEELETPHEVLGVLPLHVACSCDTIDIYVLRCLLDAAPDSARQVDNEGSTPLHFLLHYGSPKNDVIRLLIEAFPDAIAVRDKYGRTPLFHAIDNSISLDCLKIMLDTGLATDSILQCCNEAVTQSRGTHAARQRAYELSRLSATWRTPLYMAWRNALRPQNGDVCTKKGKRWDKALLLLKFAYSHKAPTAKFRTLHATLEFCAYLPTAAIEIDYELALVKEAEEGTGRLPLHIAASIDSTDDEVVASIIEALLLAYPDAAKHETVKGRLPLHEAILAGKTWEMYSFQRLLQAYPSAMHSADGATGLYPFMLAASVETLSITGGCSSPSVDVVDLSKCSYETCAKCNETMPQGAEDKGYATTPLPEVEVKDDSELKKLDTIFELLLANPEFFNC
jgi:ankyrin repeat protein